MSKFEVAVMFVSFGAIVMIGVAQGNREDTSDSKSYVFFEDDA